MENSRWVVDGEPSKAEKIKQLNHVSIIAATDDMSEGQKEFARAYNEMRDTLIQNKLMKSK